MSDYQVPDELIPLVSQILADWDRRPIDRERLPSTAARVDVDREQQARQILAAVLPAHKATIRAEIIMAERAAIITGIKEYFAASDDPLYDDVQTLCGRIERGEYGTRGET